MIQRTTWLVSHGTHTEASRQSRICSKALSSTWTAWAVAHAVHVLDNAFEHIRDCLDASVWVPWETSHVVRWIIGTKVVKQKKWVSKRRIAEAKDALQAHASSLHYRLFLKDCTDSSVGHNISSSR